MESIRSRAPRAATLCALALAAAAPRYPAAAGAGTAAPAAPAMHLRVAFLKTVFAEEDARDAQAAIELWMKNVIGAEGITSELFTYRTLESVAEGFREKDVDLVHLDTLSYLRMRDGTPLEPILVGVRGDSPCEEYVLAVRREGQVASPASLEGRTLNVLSGPGGAIATLWLDTVLMREGLPPAREACRSVKASTGASQALLPVFFGQADACLLSRRAFQAAAGLNPQLLRSLRVAAESPPYLPMVCCCRARIDGALRDALVDSALSLDRTPAGGTILALVGSDRIAAFEPAQLENVEALAREHAHLLRKRDGRRGTPR